MVLRALLILLALMGLTWDPPLRVPVPHFGLVRTHPGCTNAVGVSVLSPVSGFDSLGTSSPDQTLQSCLVSGPVSICL